MQTLKELYEEEAETLRLLKIVKIGQRKLTKELRAINAAIYEHQQLSLFTETATVTDLRSFIKDGS